MIYGVRQGPVLSSFLFAIYRDGILASGSRSIISASFILLYEYDILLIAPSTGELQRIFQACEHKLSLLESKVK